MGAMGLTEKQIVRLDELYQRKHNGGKKLTDNMEVELDELIKAKANPKLPTTATTFLREWYAGDNEPVFSKFIDKGNYVESDLIDFMAEQLGFGLAEKNTETKEDEYFIGTCDVKAPNLIVDVKAAWNITTLQSCISQIDSDHEYQGRGYMRLWDKDGFIVFHGLLNTPPEVNYDREVTYDHLPDNERWIAYKITRDQQLEQAIIDRVIMCRKWLDGYDQLVNSKLGKIHIL